MMKSGLLSKNNYFSSSLSLYINYIIHGMALIIIAQNRVALASRWETNDKGIALVISMFGIGKLLATFISGRLSDKFGRKTFIYLGIVTYSSFFLGTMLSTNVNVACFFAIVAGIANSFLDAGTYPALMEMYPKAAGTANVLIKAFVQIGQVLLPFIVSFIITQNLWYGWSFLFAIALFILNGIFLSKRVFPPANQSKETISEHSERTNYIEGICFIIYGYIGQATFYLISQFMPQYGEIVAELPQTEALRLISYYATGSLFCVCFTAIAATKIRPIYLMLVYTLLSFVMISVIWMFPNPIICKIGSFVIGFSAAGGVLQLGLTVMAEMFPVSKGTVTGIYFTCGSIAAFTIPLIAAEIAEKNVRSIMLFDMIMAAIGFVIVLIIFIRYRQSVQLTKK